MGARPQTDSGSGLGHSLIKKSAWLQCIQHVADGFTQTMVAGLGFNDRLTVIKPLAANRKNLSRPFPETLMKAWLNAEQQRAVGHLTHLGGKPRRQIAIKALMRPTVLADCVQGSLKVCTCKALRAPFACRQITVRCNRRYWLPAPGDEARRIYSKSPLMRTSAYHTNRKTRARLAFSIMINANATWPTILFMAWAGRGQFRQ